MVLKLSHCSTLGFVLTMQMCQLKALWLSARRISLDQPGSSHWDEAHASHRHFHPSVCSIGLLSAVHKRQQCMSGKVTGRQLPTPAAKPGMKALTVLLIVFTLLLDNSGAILEVRDRQC